MGLCVSFPLCSISTLNGVSHSLETLIPVCIIGILGFPNGVISALWSSRNVTSAYMVSFSLQLELFHKATWCQPGLWREYSFHVVKGITYSREPWWGCCNELTISPEVSRPCLMTIGNIFLNKEVQSLQWQYAIMS